MIFLADCKLEVCTLVVHVEVVDQDASLCRPEIVESRPDVVTIHLQVVIVT